MTDDPHRDWIPLKADRLDITQLPDGYMVRETTRDRVHYLNREATLVFEMCDGRHSAATIPAILQTACGLEAPPASAVDECLARFLAEGLVRRR